MKWLLLAVALCTYSAVAFSQRVLDPQPLIAVCAYSLTPPTVASGQFVYMQCDNAGNLQ